MDTGISFGECLKQLLLIRNWPASRLAREINIDPSYVRMWVRGERVPALQSDYVDAIAAALLKNIDSAGKQAMLIFCSQNFMYYTGVRTDEHKPLAEQIAAVLKSAQIYSLSSKPRIRRKKYTQGKDLIACTNGWAGAGIVGCGGIDPAEAASYLKVSDIPMCIEGQYSILHAVFSVIKTAVDNHSGDPCEIIVTAQSNSWICQDYPTASGIWKDMISKALRQKWTVRYIYRLNKDSARSARIVEDIAEWIRYKNAFFPYYIAISNMVDPPLEFLAVKGIGAFIMMGTGNGNYIDKALFFRQKDIVKTICGYAMKICNNANTSMTYFRDFYEYAEFLAVKCRVPGHFYTISLDLHFCTIPLQLWEKYLARTVADAEKREKLLQKVTGLIRAFHEDINKFGVRQICQLEILEWMVESHDYFCLYGYQKPEAEDILEHLEHVIHLLKTCPNYEIAFVSENQRDIFLPTVVLEVRGGRNAGIISLDMESHFSYNYLAVTEATLASSFDDYFTDMWEKVTPKFKDKEYVISWLEKKAQYLRGKLASIEKI